MRAPAARGAVMELFQIVADWVIDFVVYMAANTDYVHVVIFFGLCMWLTGSLYATFAPSKRR